MADNKADSLRGLIDTKVKNFDSVKVKRWESPEAALEILEQAVHLVDQISIERGYLWQRIDEANGHGII